MYAGMEQQYFLKKQTYTQHITHNIYCYIENWLLKSKSNRNLTETVAILSSFISEDSLTIFEIFNRSSSL